MNAANIKDAFEILGIFALVASLVFVGLELRQAQALATLDRR